MDYSIAVTDGSRLEDRDAIGASLVEFNLRHAPAANHQALGILLRGPDGETIGGLWGRSAYEWLFVELLFVPESLRGAGLATELMARAEAIARERGCTGVWLDTFSFQARPFYEKLGYTVFAELADRPRGVTQFWLKKRFDTLA